jgi:hypothetical protein
LIEYISALWEMDRRVPSSEERRDLKACLAKVKRLDIEKTLPF